jgi:hypothetical protein
MDNPHLDALVEASTFVHISLSISLSHRWAKTESIAEIKLRIINLHVALAITRRGACDCEKKMRRSCALRSATSLIGGVMREPPFPLPRPQVYYCIRPLLILIVMILPNETYEESGLQWLSL